MPRVAIIGGGVVGASAAYRLARGGAQVVVVDRADAGQATAAGAGILPPSNHFSAGGELGPLIAHARAHYRELLACLLEDGELDTGYEVVGALHVATSAAELERLPEVESDAQRRASAGLPHVGTVRALDGAGARALFPALGAHVLGAIHMAGAARIDGRRLLRALRRAAERRGAEWLEGSARLLPGQGGARGVAVGERTLEADAVIVAGGAWSRALSEQLGLRVLVSPQRGQLVHLRLPGTRTAHWPIVLGFGTQYLLAFPEDRIVAGATRESTAGFDCRVTVEGATSVLRDALELAPLLAGASVEEFRVGFRPLAADGKPVLGASRLAPNVYFATGHGGFGLELGPYSGALVADCALGVPAPFSLAPFAPDRFTSG